MSPLELACPRCAKAGNDGCEICEGRGKWMLTECPKRFAADADVGMIATAVEEYAAMRAYPDGRSGWLTQPAILVEAMRIYRRFTHA